ncbi:MAG: right-handed parallel beta-helix repeat-containing protein [Faecalibacterium sp.]
MIDPKDFIDVNENNFFVRGQKDGGVLKSCGKYPEAVLNGCDGPFTSIEIAIEQVRSLNLPGKTTVWLREGRYELKNPLTFTEQDSNPVTFAAYPGEQVVLDGGRKIEGWQETTVHGRRALKTNIPAVAAGEWDFNQLFVDETRATKTRLPETGFFRIEHVPQLDLAQFVDVPEHRTNYFYAREGDIKPSYDLSAAEVVMVHYWVEERMPIVSYQPDTRKMQCALSGVFPLKDDVAQDYAKYWIENSFAALKKDGEYYLDKTSGDLYYLPFPDQTAENIVAYAPVHTQLVRFRGNPQTGQLAGGITFKGITFAHCDYNYDMYASGENKYHLRKPLQNRAADHQAAYSLPGVVQMEYTKNVSFEDCTIEHCGFYGFSVDFGCTGIKIVGNTIRDMGAGGVKIIGGHHALADITQTGSIFVTDNTIEDAGHVFLSAIGILVIHSANNVLAHNHIHHLRYSGISCGWVWGYGKSNTYNNKIEKNHIHHLGLKTINDMGGIYTLGTQPGTTIRGNVIHDVQRINYGGWGIYTDEGSSYILIENNICYHEDSQAFNQHYGKENIVRNNIFAFSELGQAKLLRIESHNSFTFMRNIVVSNNRPAMTSNHKEMWIDKHIVSDLNLFYDYQNEAPYFCKERRNEKAEYTFIKDFDIAQIRALGHERNSIVADPLFVDAEHFDFTLQENSPAFALGFVPIDASDVGPRPVAKRDNAKFLPSLAAAQKK